MARAVTEGETPYHNPPTGISLVAPNEPPQATPKAPQAPLPRKYVPKVTEAQTNVREQITQEFGANHIMMSVAENESMFDETVCNSIRACGLFQIIPSTFKSCKVEGLATEAIPNIKCARILYDRRGLKDWEDSRTKGASGGWGKDTSTMVGA